MQRKFVGFTCYETKYPDSKLGVFWDLKGVWENVGGIKSKLPKFSHHC
jgi:hypothetical protein